MKDIKKGKLIVDFVKKMKNKGEIEDYKIDIDEDGYPDIRININKDYGLNVYPEYSSMTGKFTEWTVDFIQEGHNMYYSNPKTYKQVAEDLEDRIRYSNIAYRNELGEKYQNLSKDDLIKILVSKDIELEDIHKNMKEKSKQL